MSHASKIEKAEGQLDFRESARTLHNKVSNTLLSCFLAAILEREDC